MTRVTPDAALQRVVLVTGPGGAGRSTAIAALEDAGFEAVDNLPLALVPRIVGGTRPLVLGIDARTRGFSSGGLLALTAELTARPDLDVELVYLDCAPDVLVRRYSETRRRHPAAPDGDAALGIGREADLLAAVRAGADALIDTSLMSPHDLKAEMARRFGSAKRSGLSVTVMSFSYKRGIPRQADTVVDLRFLANPYWEASLRPLDGNDPRVRAYVEADPRFAPLRDAVMSLAEIVIPGHEAEGRSYFTLAFGCTGGQHRSVTLARGISEGLAGKGYRVSTRHRELERRAAASPPLFAREGTRGMAAQGTAAPEHGMAE